MMTNLFEVFNSVLQRATKHAHHSMCTDDILPHELLLCVEEKSYHSMPSGIQYLSNTNIYKISRIWSQANHDND